MTSAKRCSSTSAGARQVKRVWRLTTSCLRSNMALRSREALISWKAFMLPLSLRGSSSCMQLCLVGGAVSGCLSG